MQELFEFSIGLGIASALFRTFAIFPLFRELLNIRIMTEANVCACVFQKYHLVRMLCVAVFAEHYTPFLIKAREGITVSLGIDCN